MRLLITGTSGFIGKNLKCALEDEYKLLTPKHSELELTNENAVKEYFKNNKIDFIIHCASKGGARGIKDEKTTIEDNLAMVSNLVKFKRDDVRIILFGSGAMYDKSRDLHKVKEEEIGEVIPKDLYGLSKLKIANLAKLRDDITCLNIFACYGYDEKPSRFPSYAIDCVLDNKPIIINQNVTFDYLFVEDMVKIVKYFIKNKPDDKIINITPTESTSLIDIASIVNLLTDNPTGFELKTYEMNKEYTGDNTLLLKNCKGFKFTLLKEGLKKLYEYKKEQR